LAAIAVAGCAGGELGAPEGAAAAGTPDETTVAASRVSAVLAEESGLPVFHLRPLAGLEDENYRPAEIVFRGRSWPAAEAKYRGRSSLAYPKKSFTLKFPKADRFSDPDRGFVDRRRLVLITTFDDTSRLRQRLALELWSRISGIKLRTASAIVYVDGVYQGIYTVADHIDEDLLVAQGRAAGGTLYKAVSHDANFFGLEQIQTAFELKEGAPAADGSFADLADLITFLRSGSGADAHALAERIDLDSYRAWLVLVTAILATDTLAKNAYHHRDPRDGLWRTVLWDFNASFGQDWDTTRFGTNVDPLSLATASNLIFSRLVNTPGLAEGTRESYRALLAGPLSREVVLGLVADYARELAPAVPRDEQRWGQEHRAFPRWAARTDFKDFDAEVAYVRRWIETRWTALAAALVAPPSLTSAPDLPVPGEAPAAE
jgi:hypothetical protein